jgi:aminoglycoside 3-N-acetyltransferase I
MTAPVQYSYRQIARADVALLRDLLRVFGEAFDEAPTYRNSPSDDYLGRVLGKPHVIVLVAMAEDEVVGGVAAYELDKLEQDRREIYIYDLAVAAPHRRRGVARRLIHELGQIASGREVYVMFVQADLTDAPAIALYAGLGTQTTAHHFDIAVPHRSAGPAGIPNYIHDMLKSTGRTGPR